MGPHGAAAAILVLCLLLVVLAYALGLEAGRAGALRSHPGYTGLPSPRAA